MGIFGIAAARPTRADPIPNAVCGQGVVIPGEIAFLGTTPDDLCPCILSGPAETPFPWSYSAPVDAEPA